MTSEQRQERVLAKAVVNVAVILELTAEQIGAPVGAKALQLIRVYKLLLSITGSKENASHWMHTRIRPLNAVPADIISQDNGLDKIEGYLEQIAHGCCS